MPQWHEQRSISRPINGVGLLKSGGSKLMSQVTGALMRAFFVALLVALPALLLPDVSRDVAQVVTLLALIAAVVTFAEYSATYPGLIQFRDAPPYNRIRFIVLFFLVLLLSLLVRTDEVPTMFGLLMQAVAVNLGDALNFPYSPVRLLVLSLPAGLDQAHLNAVLAAGAVGYSIGLLGLLGFFIAIFTGYWPQRYGQFNVWVNLPTFDPTAGLDVVQRLERDAVINIALGIVMPFILPVLLRASTILMQPVTLESPQSLVWGITAWAFIPVSLIMRGIAMNRVAVMIREKRREIAAAEDLIPRPPQSVYS